MKHMLKLAICLVILLGFSHCVLAQNDPRRGPDHPEAIESELIRGTAVMRAGRTLQLNLDSQDDSGEAHIPRFAASLKRVAWKDAADQQDSSGLSLTPEQEHWVIKWKDRTSENAVIVLEFDSSPLLIEETEPVTSSGDGSFLLPAHMARISGEKVRYEPQSHKNTVGYWTGKKDQATWRFDVQQPGKFNVGILQGCGKGHGGSKALMEFSGPAVASDAATSQPETTLEFEVLETGHFQNFQWRHLGTVEISNTGTYTLRIVPTAIKKAALMDVRAINLTRLPN